MQIIPPNTMYQQVGSGLAPRPVSLSGVTIGFLDGWGEREPDGRITMYALMREFRALVAARYGVADFIWHKKNEVSRREPRAFLKDFAESGAFAINGEAAG